MPEKSVDQKHHATFEEIRHIDDEGNEIWLARPLAKVLDYSEYRHFLPVVERAREACRNSGYPTEDHFEDILEMVDIGSGARRELPDVRLSRYACYLIVQNGDPNKPVIANGQTYFAMQTRRQELADDAKFAQLGEDDMRLAIRNEFQRPGQPGADGIDQPNLWHGNTLSDAETYGGLHERAPASRIRSSPPTVNSFWPLREKPVTPRQRIASTPPASISRPLIRAFAWNAIPAHPMRFWRPSPQEGVRLKPPSTGCVL